ncbi:filamentous hemagglutinin family protein [Rhodopseudomonas sp. P2A-2r]|uniref:filamentous haemagglutinin family protein n=1 Tax=Rhodopseudomonas sp. P2A-2r TaxID=2991972 RepID=UPI002234DA01|nr:filamentous haemagglutinin family protein [Rhodopseudomonas sp. P2A-2r]UZE50516.1 filamentous hemagglutinin family protein [Rhodopseudomonas sp. P2A-2r]
MPTSKLQSFGGGILSVGNQRNPYLPAEGADINVAFGAGKGADYAGLREAYVAPGSAANALGDYSAKLVSWMRSNARTELLRAYNTTDVSADDAYAVFVTLPQLRQRAFLIKQVYFNELAATADPKGVSYLKYSRGYAAVNTLFPASLGYTANGLTGGAGDSALVSTGDLDLRLAAIETMFGGDISILGPGGRVIAGSVVATSQQAARRTFDGGRLFSGGAALAAGLPTTIRSIPTGYEGVLTLRGGDIYTFTDSDFLLNQSRLFTEQGGDIVMWSSNADLNAGQGAKTSANFPPIVAHIDQNADMTVDVLGGVTGAGIAALQSTPTARKSKVYLIAPRGTVNAGDAGLRVSGDLSIAALRIVNADNIKVGGVTTGVPTVQAPNIVALTESSNATAATQQATSPTPAKNDNPSVIIVEVLGYGGGDNNSEEERRQKANEKRSDLTVPNRTASYDTGSAVQVLGDGALGEADSRYLTLEERRKLSPLVVVQP